MIVCGWFTQGASYFSTVSGKPLDFFDRIIGFEAKKDFDVRMELSHFDEEIRKRVMLYKKAVYINDDGIEFYDYGKGSSTVLKNKGEGVTRHHYKLEESYRVESVDFVKYLENFPKDEYELYIQMNVEGAEFCILDKMLETEIFNNLDIRQFYIDYHTNFEGREEKLKNKVKEHKKLMMKYFAQCTRRARSNNPEDFLFSGPIAQG